MLMRHWILAAVLAAAVVPGLSASARAGMIPVQVSVTPDAGNYLFSYSIVLPTDALLQPGDYFTIYNFDGLVPGTAASSGSSSSSDWTFSTSTTGPTPPGLAPPVSNPSSGNISWTYNGPDIQGSQTLLGTFSVISIYPSTTQSWFTAITGTVSGVSDSNITPTTVPVPTAAPPGLPEPGTLVLAALGIPFLGMVWRFRR